MVAAFEMRLPDEIHEIDVVERADHRLERVCPFLRSLPRRQCGDCVEGVLVCPHAIPRQEARAAEIDHGLAPSGAGHEIPSPPSTAITCPVTHSEAGLASATIHRATSSGLPRRLSGICSRSRSLTASACSGEEHTSELQSLMRISYAVFCLKKKKQKTPIQSQI